MFLRIAFLSVAALFLALLPTPVKGAAPRQVKWEGLSMVVGREVSVVMPGGAVVRGKATEVGPDALVVSVHKTSDSTAYPKGTTRVPRASLHTLEMHTKGHKFRVIGTVLGATAGLAGGVAAAIGIQGGLFGNQHQGAAAAACIGIAAAGTVGGYLAGNAADRQSTMIEVLP